jgi:hypothetical protein
LQIVAGSGTIQSVTPDITNTVFTIVITGVGGVGGNPAAIKVLANGYTDVAGNLGLASNNIAVGNPGTQAFPAGVAGEPINLGLADLSHQDVLVTVTLKDVPAGWTVNGAAQNADGSWTVETNDPSALTVTTPASFTGAAVLNVSMIWTDAAGVAHTTLIANNVEAYAPGSPIFAWSGDDHLTGSSGQDLFVFSQPIGADTIYGFNAAADRIDLIGYDGFKTFADVQAHLADDAGGNAVITLGDGQSIMLKGVHAADLTASDFVFDQTPVTDNPATMIVGDGAMLPLSGVIHNTGTIELNAAGNGTLLELIQYGITLQGSGEVILSDDVGNVIQGTVPTVTLTNADNTISGAGQIGAGQMTLVNDGTVVATGTNALTIDTGLNVIVNTGTLEATGSGGLVVNSAIDNSGLIWAAGGNVTVNGAVSGGGSALINGTATLAFAAASSANTTFAADAAGTLVLDSFDFSGLISGMDGNDRVDLTNLAFPGAALSYTVSADGTGGLLTVSDGSHSAAIALLGQYDASGFHLASDNGTGTLITYDPLHDLMH